MHQTKTIFQNLRRYIQFLVSNHFNELVTENLRRNKEANLPLLKFYSHISDEELYHLAAKNLKNFLNMFEAEDTLEKALASIHYWKENRLTQILRNDALPSDISISNNARKQALLTFLPQYTDSVTETIEILKELEDFYTFYEFHEIKIFLEIQQDKEKELLKAMEIANIGSYSWDIVKDLIAGTSQLSAIFGWNESDFINMEYLVSFIYPDDIKTFKWAVNHAIENRLPLDIEFRIIRKDGAQRVVWNKGMATNDKGRPRMQGTIMDITEKRQNEHEIRYRELQLIEAQSIARIGSFDWDFVNNRSSCTDEIYRIFDWGKDKELNFQSFEDLAHPDDLTKVFYSLHAAIEKRETYNCEYRIITPANKQKSIWARGRITFDNKGNAIRLTGTILDITERKLSEEEINRKNLVLLNTFKKLEITQKELKEVNTDLEQRVKDRTRDLEQSIMYQHKSAEELKQKNNQLERINADLDNFIYTASHDLKAPISNIEGLVNILNGLEISTPEVKKILNMMDTSIYRFKNTIKDLTEISKVQKEANEDIKYIVFQDIADEILQESHDTISQNQASIIYCFEEPAVKFSKKNLRSILYNLLNNALKYRSEDRTPIIKIHSKKIEDYILLTISDNGLGIPENKLDKLFTMFKRFHTHVEGSGIGLYIVKRIIDNSGGKIEVESKLGSGTTFKIFFKA
ncbi:MAG: PAS domain-containing protein [Bacteroidota bacterium]|nr:PAS domain-containing protein [Bacteroidota bacterium]